LRNILAFVLFAMGTSPARAVDLRASVRDQTGAPVADAVVFVESDSGAAYPPPAEPAIMDQVDREYVPHVLAILAGTAVRFPNKDNVHHQVYSFSKAKTFELSLYRDVEPKPIVMEKAGVIKLGCNIHDWMRGYIVVSPTPYFAKTGPNGEAVLRGLPPGQFRVLAWSERLKAAAAKTAQTVEVAAQDLSVKIALTLAPPLPADRPAVSDY
jgi:plastocyanin